MTEKAYRHTHVSAHDGSPAMLVCEHGDTVFLMNEDGYEWSDPAADWLPIDPSRSPHG